MKFKETPLYIILTLVLPSACHGFLGDYDVQCTIKLHGDPPPSPLLSLLTSPSSPSSPSSPTHSSSSRQPSSSLSSSFSHDTGAGSEGYQIMCRNTFNTKNIINIKPVLKHNDINNSKLFCLTSTCRCENNKIVMGNSDREMTTCLTVHSSSFVYRAFCRCCTNECVWREVPLSYNKNTRRNTTTTTGTTTTTTTTSQAAISNPTTKVVTRKIHDLTIFTRKTPVKTHTTTLPKHWETIIIITGGLLFFAVLLLIYGCCKQKHCDTHRHPEMGRVPFFPPIFPERRTWTPLEKERPNRNKVPDIISSCGLVKPRTKSIDGGELAKQPIQEEDEEDIDEVST